jgi:hypothetical protein
MEHPIGGEDVEFPRSKRQNVTSSPHGAVLNGAIRVPLAVGWVWG